MNILVVFVLVNSFVWEPQNSKEKRVWKKEKGKSLKFIYLLRKIYPE